MDMSSKIKVAFATATGSRETQTHVTLGVAASAVLWHDTPDTPDTDNHTHPHLLLQQSRPHCFMTNFLRTKKRIKD